MEVENIPDDDVEVVGAGGIPVTEEVAEEVETTEEPVEEETAPVEEEVPAEEEVPVEEEVKEPEVDAPPELSKEDLEAKLAELDKTIAERKADAERWREEKRKQRNLYYSERRPEEELPPEQLGEEAVSPLGPEPQQEDFESYDDYYRALARYETDQRIYEHEQNRMNQTMIQELEIFKEDVVERGISKYGDFEDVARDPSLAITSQMLHMMRDLEYPEDVAYYLGRNPGEAIKIARQTPASMAMSLVKLETKIQTEFKTEPPETPTSPQPKPRTTAPPPVKPVSGGSEQVEQDPNKMTPAQYREWREKGGGGGEYE